MTGKSFTTPLGCIVTIIEAPERLGEGVLLNLRMESPLDNRMAEVFLDKESLDRLKELLYG